MYRGSILHVSSWGRLALGLCLLVGLCLALGGQARPAHAQSTLTVTDCSNDSQLQAAVNTANSDNAGDTITFSCSGIIPLTSTLQSNANMTLDGRGQSVWLNGGQSMGVLSVNSGISFTLNALTIVNGAPGSTAALNGQGAGLFNNGGTVTISNSTFAFNGWQTNGQGAGLFNNYGGTVTISNSTFGHNSAGSGSALFNEGTATISNSTFALNSGSIIIPSTGFITGLDGPGSTTISGSIVYDNGTRNCLGGHIVDQGYNLEGGPGTSCNFTGTGSLENTDPAFVPGFAGNAGQAPTFVLQQSSPAIDQIPAARCPATDQLGNARPDDAESTCDMGALESNYESGLGLTNVPANITKDATSPQGAVVTYTPPTVVDEESPLPTATCTPASGSTFPIGTTTVTCTATDSDDMNSPVSQSFTVTVKPVLTASGKNVSATEGKSFSGVVVATGTAYGAGALSASIDWGDGQTTSSTLSLAPDGSYSVTGSHVYDEEGSFAIKVTVSGSGSGAPNATATSSASVADAALTANMPTVLLNKLAVTLTTVFFDADPNGTASDYSVTNTWGDGSSSTGTISMNSTNFSAAGSHSYAKHGTYTLTVTIRDAGGSSVTKTLSVKV